MEHGFVLQYMSMMRAKKVRIWTRIYDSSLLFRFSLHAVSIHKAQGLEYDSVKVIIPSNNAEKITHGIFYTAITRAKTNLKIYWSSETMHDVVKGFATDESKRKSLEIVKTKLGKN